MALDRRDGAVNVGNSLALGGLANQDVAVLGEGHHRRGGSEALGIGNDLRFTRLQHGHRAIGGSQVNSYCSTHLFLLISKLYGLS
ncbi:unannotated protein [freshwater metagenome]|uniref:Unannotated protein n=1 Tax=freshwater metagenome TaxID=449393 RepID=A0A6J6ELX4_9ZZZZ